MPTSFVFKAAMCSLQLYFLLMNVTVERCYCHGPLLPDDDRFLMRETYEFSLENNRYFLQRPTWLAQATCVHAYIFWMNYLLILMVTVTDAWHHPVLAKILLLFCGAKLYAILFYHYMEFSSDVPPEHLVPYFAAEGPYLVSIALVLRQISVASSPANHNKQD